MRELRPHLIGNGLGALLLCWWYGGELADGVRARSAELSAFAELPGFGFSALALAVAVGAAAATGWGVWKRRDAKWRGYRLMPIAVVVLLFVDLLVISSNRSPLGSADRTALVLRTLADAAGAKATVERVPADQGELQAVADQFGAPPYLQRGAPLDRWRVVVRAGCSGPVGERGDAAPGTIFYCVAANGKTAWLSAVTLPHGVRFGAPTLFSREGEVFSPQVTAIQLEPEEPGPAPLAPGESWLDPADSGS